MTRHPIHQPADDYDAVCHEQAMREPSERRGMPSRKRVRINREVRASLETLSPSIEPLDERLQ